jgi:hypothetical protein
MRGRPAPAVLAAGVAGADVSQARNGCLLAAGHPRWRFPASLKCAPSGQCFFRIWMASGLPNFGHWMAFGFYPFMMGVHQLTL